ncbi:hypothetical protein R1sor_007257 [Riccia sorocarpa]|uniref:Uncharacterized protein n=1 Tax=Riccia sorocarpa TaxID=122646 RepID=A0ABD3HS53_9MARC
MDPFDPDRFVDSAMRRALMRLPEWARDTYMRRNPEQLAIMPEYRPRSDFGGVDAITYGAIQWITQPLIGMTPQQRLTVYQQNPILARHFPDLDPRNRRPQNLGPVLPLDRSLLIRYVGSWPEDELRRQFHLAPWLRHQFPEFAPPGGWPPRLFLPLRTFREFGEDIYNVQGPAELYEDWPIRDPALDPEPFNYVDSAHRPLSPRREHDFQVRSRTPSPTINERRFRRAPPTTSWQGLQSYRQVGNISADRYYDPARYRRGDPAHGYIRGHPEPPIYHDFDPRGHPLEDEHYVSRPRLLGPPVEPADRRDLDAVDYNRPQTRNYPRREPFDMVWDDNFTPAEHRHGHSPPRSYDNT